MRIRLEKASKGILMGFSLLTLIGCTTTSQYRTDQIYSPGNDCPAGTDPAQCPIGFAPTGQGFRLGVIEFDDQGELLDQPPEFSFVMGDVQNGPQEPGYQGKLVVLFAHGWFENAAPQNENLALFRTMLAIMAKDEKAVAAQESRPARMVQGVFLAWRGANSYFPVLKYLTFWNRKDTAQRIGERRASEVILSLRAAAYSGSTISDEVPNRFIVMGHSFGGALVYSATSQLIANHILQSPPDGSAPPQSSTVSRAPLADAVILFNPAFEAARVSHLLDTAGPLQRRLPTLSIFTSKTDRATGWAFPAARFINTLLEAYRDVTNPLKTGPDQAKFSQRTADTLTIGHFSPYLTHTLVKADSGNSQCSVHPALLTHSYAHVTSGTPPVEAGQQSTSNAIDAAQTQLMNEYENHADVLNFGETCLVKQGGLVNDQLAVFNVAMDSDIWDGHTIEQTEDRRKLILGFLEHFVPFAATGDVIPPAPVGAEAVQAPPGVRSITGTSTQPRRRRRF